MASVFKPRHPDGARYQTWYVSLIDEQGKRRKLKGYRDKGATEQLARRLQSDVDKIRAGETTRAKVDAATHPIGDHVAEFVAEVRRRGRSAKHVNALEAQLCRVVADCGFRSLSDVEWDSVAVWLADRVESGWSGTTCNNYLRSVKSFTRWAHRTDRIQRDPMILSSPVAKSPVYQRRALDPESIAALLAATRSAPPFRKLSGVGRWTLYLVAMTTGLRRKELAALLVADLDLGPAPTLRLDGRDTKNGRDAVQPLRADVASALRVWIGSRKIGPVFPGTWSERSAKMVRMDLHRAGIPHIDERLRVFDFHSFRVQFVSMLMASGASPKTTQELARHADPRLTLEVYAKSADAEARAAVEALPLRGHQCGHAIGGQRQTGADDGGHAHQAKSTETVADRPETGKSVMPLPGLEPGTRGLRIRSRSSLVVGGRETYGGLVAYVDAHVDTTLAAIVRHWPQLTADARRAIAHLAGTGTDPP